MSPAPNPEAIRPGCGCAVSRPAGSSPAPSSVTADDLSRGLGLAWHPPAALRARVLARLFPDTPGSTGPWTTPLWATGRAELDGRPRLATWRWDGTVRA